MAPVRIAGVGFPGMNGRAPGGPTFSGGQQPIGGDWWAWGCLTGQNPNGCVGEDGKVRPEQAPFINQILFRPSTPAQGSSR